MLAAHPFLLIRVHGVVPIMAAMLGACSLQPVSTDSSSDSTTTDTTSGAVTGSDCGLDSASGATLCLVTSQCPSVVIDSSTFPNCGFRIRGSIAELVCGCGEYICSMGAFTTCDQAEQLLSQQTEVSVCDQIAEGRCTAGTPTTSSTGSSDATSSSSSSSSGSSSSCDRTCLAECGGGAACASVCECF
ncbi:MAG: hypothetical protein FWD69_09005 [Polyangiaceae bacterium]|nr:hypothetical protein [Polyangiaceae bacterium]